MSIESPDGENTLQFGALVQLDGRFDVGDSTSAAINTFVLRRVRPILQGRVAKVFEFRLMPDFGNGTTALYDAYIDTKLSSAFRVRVGKDKTPLGYEQLLPDYGVVFPERTLVSSLVPNRDLGVQAQGDLARGRLKYVVGAFNGVPDGTSGDLDENNGKDAGERLTLKLGGFGVAMGGTQGRQAGTLPSFKTAAQQTFFSYSHGTAADGMRTRVSPAAFVFYKAWGAFAEYVRSTQAVTKGAVHADVANTAWEVTAVVIATGEWASDRGVAPARTLGSGSGNWGALQLAARYGALAVDRRVFVLGLAAAGASRTARAIGVDATWYPNAFVKGVLSYERTAFDEASGSLRRPEHAIVFRFQLNLQPTL